MLFIKGLEMYGKSWKKISQVVTTRTVVQIRTHAQKYLIKMEKAKRAGHKGLLLMDGKVLIGEEDKRTKATTTKDKVSGCLKPIAVQRK